LKETLWIPLRDNAWIYVAPVPEHLTVLCTGQKPTDTEIAGSGVFTFFICFYRVWEHRYNEICHYPLCKEYREIYSSTIEFDT
jgi:hypothetical protein